MNPSDRATDTAFANALLDSAIEDGPAPDALGRELERLGLGTVAGVVAVTALAGGAAPTTTVAAASKLTAASIFSGAAVKIGVVAAIAVAGASYVALRAPSSTSADATARAPTSAAAANSGPRAPSAPLPAIVPSSPGAGVSTQATAATTSSAVPAPPNATSTSTAAASGPPTRSPEDARALAAEVSLVDRARALAHRSPDAALALLDEHARTFPYGSLRDEAAVVRVEALLAAGRRDDAERVARPFLAERAGTPLARRLSDLLGTSNRSIP